MNKRKSARGEECLVRIPGVCNFDPETTVLAHYGIAGYFGKGMKPDDDLGAYACSSCHDVMDGRVKRPYDLSKTDISLMHAEGVMRTWMRRKELAK